MPARYRFGVPDLLLLPICKLDGFSNKTTIPLLRVCIFIKGRVLAAAIKRIAKSAAYRGSPI